MNYLREDQLLNIETYLNQKDLTQIDLRNEVLDHIANGIETKMDSENRSFEEAFSKEVITWNKELSNYSSWWLGIAWIGPKIMMKKCVEILKRFYFKMLLFTLLSTLILYLLLQFVGDVLAFSNIDKLFGLLFFASSMILCYFGYQINTTKYKTSFSFLFNRHCFPFILFYLVINPFVLETHSIFIEDKINIIVLACNTLAVSNMAFSYFLLKSHMQVKKIKMA